MSLLKGKNRVGGERVCETWRAAAFVFLICFLCCVGCGRRDTVRMLDKAEVMMSEHPDSALILVQAIDTSTLDSPRLRARHALLYAMALDKNWIDTTDANIIMPAVKYYGRRNSGDRPAKTWYYLGRIQQNSGDRAAAGISFLKSDRASEKTRDLRFKTLVYDGLSSVYGQTHLYEEALEYTILSNRLAEQAGDTLNLNAGLFRLAQDLNNVGRYEEADSLFDMLIHEKKIHPNVRPSLLSNHALNLVNRSERYEEAVRLYEEVIASTGSLEQVNFWGAYAYALTKTGNTARADQIFTQLNAIKETPSLRFIYTSWKSKVAADAGDYVSAYLLQKEASEIQTQNVRTILRQSTVKAQKEFLEEVNLISAKKSRKRQIEAWGSCILLLVVLMLLLLYFKFRNEHAAQEKESLLEACKDLTTQHSVLVSRYAELNRHMMRMEEEKASVRNQYIQICQSHFNRLGRVNEMLYYYAGDSDNRLYQELKKCIGRIRLDEESQNEFEKLLNDSFDNVMIHFRESFPGKKERYYRLVSFLFAGFSTTTICVIIASYNKHNIYVEKSRLKQMICASDSSYKEQFLQMLS